MSLSEHAAMLVLASPGCAVWGMLWNPVALMPWPSCPNMCIQGPSGRGCPSFGVITWSLVLLVSLVRVKDLAPQASPALWLSH